MKLRILSPSHDVLRPNYRARWYRQTDNVKVFEQFFNLNHGAIQPVGTGTPQEYEVSNVQKPAGPHASPYLLTIAAEATTGASPESAPAGPVTLSPPEQPSIVAILEVHL